MHFLKVDEPFHAMVLSYRLTKTKEMWVRIGLPPPPPPPITFDKSRKIYCVKQRLQVGVCRNFLVVSFFVTAASDYFWLVSPFPHIVSGCLCSTKVRCLIPFLIMWCLNCFALRMGTKHLTGTYTHLAVYHVREFVCPCAYFLLSRSVMGNTLTSQLRLSPFPVTHSHSAILGADCRLFGKVPSSFSGCWKYLAFSQYL